MRCCIEASTQMSMRTLHYRSNRVYVEDVEKPREGGDSAGTEGASERATAPRGSLGNRSTRDRVAASAKITRQRVQALLFGHDSFTW